MRGSIALAISNMTREAAFSECGQSFRPIRRQQTNLEMSKNILHYVERRRHVSAVLQQRHDDGRAGKKGGGGGEGIRSIDDRLHVQVIASEPLYSRPALPCDKGAGQV